MSPRAPRPAGTQCVRASPRLPPSGAPTQGSESAANDTKGQGQRRRPPSDTERPVQPGLAAISRCILTGVSTAWWWFSSHGTVFARVLTTQPPLVTAGYSSNKCFFCSSSHLQPRPHGPRLENSDNLWLSEV